MLWKNASTRHLRRLFLEGFSVMDIAEPLISFDAAAPAAEARKVLVKDGLDLAGVRCDGLVEGYVRSEDLTTGECGDHIHPFTVDDLVDDNEPLVAAIRSLAINQRCFITVLGRPGAIITLHDLEKPAVRMLLFGMITLVEMMTVRYIRENFTNGSWQEFVPPQRLAKAEALQQERLRRNRAADLLDCLQFSDKGQILLRDPEFIKASTFSSRSEGKKALKELESLRNNLAHSQAIVPDNWQRIATFSGRLELLLDWFATGELPPRR